MARTDDPSHAPTEVAAVVEHSAGPAGAVGTDVVRVDGWWPEPAEDTVGALWHATFPSTPADELLRWPPDVFALTTRLLDATEAYRLVVSPPPGRTWPPGSNRAWQDEVCDAACVWGDWLDGQTTELPPLLTDAWAHLLGARDVPLAQLTTGAAWEACTSILTLHALADEACAGVGNATDATTLEGYLFRARARDVLTTRGSLSRADPRIVRILPKGRFAGVGLTLRSLSRYLAPDDEGVHTVWRKLPAFTASSAHREGHQNILCLPWPLQVRSADFHRLPGPLHNMDEERFGFFEYAPAHPLDADLVRRLLDAAQDEVGKVHAVMLPEAALTRQEVPQLEQVLHDHDVRTLVAGVRQAGSSSAVLGRNYVHVGIWLGGRWRRYHQHKHHRWSLDESQVLQYHLGATLHPSVRWWESIAIPRRSVQVIDTGAGVTLAPLVCEDLARQDEVAQLVRAVGPTLVVTILLDGPQLTSRWTARYASVLADDPGSSVLTLTALGMAERSRPAGRSPSRVVALWKDPIGGAQEIPLDPGCQAVVVSTYLEPRTLWTADGRRHTGSVTMALGGIRQLRVQADAPPCEHRAASNPTGASVTNRDLSRITSWLEALAEVASHAPDQLLAVLDQAQHNTWGVPAIDGYAAQALDEVEAALRSAGAGERPLALEEVRALAQRLNDEGEGVARLAGRVLSSVLHQRAASV